MIIKFIKQHAVMICLFLVFLVLALLGDTAREFFRYDPKQMESHHQWWRLITANLVHTNWTHWALNSLGLVLVWYIFNLQLKPLAWAGFLLVLAPAHLLVLYWFVPTLGWYVGFSGVLHGWLAAAAIFDVRGHYWVGLLLLLGLIIKVFWEQYYGSATGLSDLIEAKVATEAHFSGVMVGILMGLLWPDKWLVNVRHRDLPFHSLIKKKELKKSGGEPL